MNSYYNHYIPIHSQYLVSSPFNHHFEQQLAWHRFCWAWGPYVTLGISIVFHGAWCKGSRGLEGKKNDSPVEKNLWQKNGWQQLLNFQIVVVFSYGTFLQCSFFLGWRILKVSNGIIQRWLFRSLGSSFTSMIWGTTGVLTTHDPGTPMPIFLDHGREENPWLGMEIHEI